jgi:hypothetical protein
MIIERNTNEFIIRLPFNMIPEKMQDIIDYLRYKELVSNFSVEQSEVDNLSSEINKKWWLQNQSKFDTSAICQNIINI